MTFSIGKLLPKLICPRTGTSLSRRGDKLISEAGDEYPIVNGKPVLVRQITTLHTSTPPASITSANATYFASPSGYADDAVIINLGSGNVPSSDPRVVSLDVLPTENTNIVCEAEYLPFATGTVDCLVSGAVFEHVWNPLKAVAEVRRVLKEGGLFHIDTAFMQGYHGFPHHYFNMTPVAAETFLVDDFELVESRVPESGTVVQAVSTILSRFLDTVGDGEASRLLDLPLRGFLDKLNEDTTHASHLLRGTSEFARRALAASILVCGRKPIGYDTTSTAHFAALRRAYYAARHNVFLRHHECEYYRGKALEIDPDASGFDVPALEGLLSPTRIVDPLLESRFERAVQLLTKVDHNLTAIRDAWITKYLTLKESPTQ